MEREINLFDKWEEYEKIGRWSYSINVQCWSCLHLLKWEIGGPNNPLNWVGMIEVMSHIDLTKVIFKHTLLKWSLHWFKYPHLNQYNSYQRHYKAFSAVKCRAVAYIPLTIMAVPASILTVSLNPLWWFLSLSYRFVSHHSVLSPFTASAWGWLLIWVAHWHCCWFYWCNCWSWGSISSWKNSKFFDCFPYW